MGASLAMALKNSKFTGTIHGYDFPEVIDEALEQGIIDSAINNWPQECTGADIVFLCTPINIIKEHLSSLNNVVDKNTTVTDLGSTKSRLRSGRVRK